MLGVVLTLAFSFLAAGAAWMLLRKHVEDADPAETAGICGLIGLASVGLLTLVFSLPSSFLSRPERTAAHISAALAVGLGFLAIRAGWLARVRFSLPQGASLAFPASLTVMALLPLVGVLAPSDAMDWDTIAYHLAVPKLFLTNPPEYWSSLGPTLNNVPGIHHSNFPFSIDNLYISGLWWGGQVGAKAFSLAIFIFGLIAVFGLARRWSGTSAGWWAALALAGMPVVLWESGTAYVDVGHGLFAGLGAIYAAEAWFDKRKDRLLLAGIMVGFALGTKYTGMQTLFAVCLALAAAGVAGKQAGRGFRTAAVVAGLALLVGGGWYVRNAVTVGNPVYPFFYERLGGKSWDAWRGEVYRDEQQTFGVGRTPAGRDLATFGHAVLGLAYQPGRYVNPGQDQGRGFPTGAIGFAALLGGLLLAVSGRATGKERFILGVALVGFGLWFFLSQQSRYLTTLAIPLGFLAAGALSRGIHRPIIAVAIAAQAFLTVWIVKATATDGQLPVLLGRESEQEHLSRRLDFYDASRAINQKAQGVALFDTVFGFYLEVPYLWANPGHSMIIDWPNVKTGADLAREFARLGLDHVYVHLSLQPPQERDRWLTASGLINGGEPYSEEEKAALTADLRSAWRWLVADGVRSGHFQFVEPFRAGVLLRVTPES